MIPWDTMDNVLFYDGLRNAAFRVFQTVPPSDKYRCKDDRNEWWIDKNDFKYLFNTGAVAFALNDDKSPYDDNADYYIQ